MKNFFKGLSFSQLLAGALAAVTSFFLSSKIGIAGSVIGVAVASIVSTSASQIYKNVLDASSEKLQTAAQMQLSTKKHGKDGSGERSEGEEDADLDDTQDIPVEDGHRVGRTVSSSGSSHASGRAGTLTRHDRRVAIVIAVVSSLVAVGVTAGIILALTDGKGTDSVVRDIVHPTVTTPATDSRTPGQDESWGGNGQGDGQIVNPTETPSPYASSSPSPTATSGTATPTQSTGTDSGTATDGGDSGTTDGSQDADSGSTGQDATTNQGSDSGTTKKDDQTSQDGGQTGVQP